MKNKYLWIIIIIGFLLRFTTLAHEPYWLDESISVLKIQGNLDDTITAAQEDIHVPLFESFLYIWVKLFGSSEFAARSYTALLGVINIYLIYIVAKRFNKKAALPASLLMALSPMMVYFSQELRPYSQVVTFSLLSIYYFMKSLESKKKTDIALYIFTSILLIYTHILTLIFVFTQIIYVLFNKNIPKKQLLVAQTIISLSFVPWLKTFISQAAKTRHVGWIPDISLLFLHDMLYKLIPLYFIIGIFFFLKDQNKFKQKNLLYLLSFLPLIILVAISLIRPTFQARYVIYSLPFMFILLSAKKKYIIAIIATILLVTTTIDLVNVDKDNWREINDYIETNKESNDIIMLNPFYHIQPYMYYKNNTCFKNDLFTCSTYNNIVTIDYDDNCCEDRTVTSGSYALMYYMDRDIWLIVIRPELYDTSGLKDYIGTKKELDTTKKFPNNITIYHYI